MTGNGIYVFVVPASKTSINNKGLKTCIKKHQDLPNTVNVLALELILS